MLLLYGAHQDLVLNEVFSRARWTSTRSARWGPLLRHRRLASTSRWSNGLSGSGCVGKRATRLVARRWHKPPADRAGCSGGECGCMVVVVGDVSCSMLLLAVVCCDGPLRGGLAGDAWKKDSPSLARALRVRAAYALAHIHSLR